MRIGVNGRFLLYPHTGIGQYTANVLKQLSKLDKQNEYIVCVPRNVKIDFPKNVKLEVVPEMSFGTAGMKKTQWEQFKVPAFFEKSEIDAAFFPYPCNPWFFSWLEKGIRTVVTVHDVIPWTDKRYLHGLMSALYHWQTKKAVKMADKVLTVSETSKKLVAKVCGISKKRIFVAYNDVAEVYKKKSMLKDADKVLKRLKLQPGKYILYVGGYDVRKNVKFLVNEYKESKFEMPLCLVGGKNSSFDGKNIVRTGVLDEDTLAFLYANCFCFVNLSQTEGFNVPILEAANKAAPAIVSNIDVHRELFEGFVMFCGERKGSFVKCLNEMKKKRVRDKYVKQTVYLKDKYNWLNSAEVIKNTLTLK